MLIDPRKAVDLSPGSPPFGVHCCSVFLSFHRACDTRTTVHASSYLLRRIFATSSSRCCLHFRHVVTFVWLSCLACRWVVVGVVLQGWMQDGSMARKPWSNRRCHDGHDDGCRTRRSLFWTHGGTRRIDVRDPTWCVMRGTWVRRTRWEEALTDVDDGMDTAQVRNTCG